MLTFTRHTMSKVIQGAIAAICSDNKIDQRCAPADHTTGLVSAGLATWTSELVSPGDLPFCSGARKNGSVRPLPACQFSKESLQTISGKANMAENDYDAFAAAYDADNEANAWNAYYERPAILSLVGEVAGLSVLDAGCGGGAHAAALVERGAVVTGIDASAGMLEIAERRLEGRARLLSADLNEALPFENQAFDLILASLVMHYLPDWSRPLAEFNRLLPQGGRLVFPPTTPSWITRRAATTIISRPTVSTRPGSAADRRSPCASGIGRCMPCSTH
ncbi:UNVERIFIED_ORG: ubiquinone/menaquinone biosynthesis C-methylase UbiE [Rhizobium etli]